MKGFLVLLLLGLIALSAFNFWQIQELKQEIASLEQKALDQQRRADASDRVITQVGKALADARDALTHMDTRQAEASLDAARRRIEETARSVGKQAEPATSWLQDSARTLGDRVRGLVGSGEPSSAPARNENDRR